MDATPKTHSLSYLIHTQSTTTRHYVPLDHSLVWHEANNPGSSHGPAEPLQPGQLIATGKLPKSDVAPIVSHGERRVLRETGKIRDVVAGTQEGRARRIFH